MPEKPTYEELAKRVRELEQAEFERKRAVGALREQEAHIPTTVDEIFLPKGDAEGVELADLIDAQAIQATMDDFFELTNIGVAILDRQGTVLVATGWQDVCVKFHRIHPETCKNCHESDTILSRDVVPGTFRIYRCKNNMWDISTPIIIGGKHMGNLFLGQFFFEDEPPDAEVFRSQARRFGFDEEEYLLAIDHVPRWSREKVVAVMNFYTKFAHLISTQSYANLKLTRALMERDYLLDSLRERDERYQSLIQTSLDGFWAVDLKGRLLEVNDAYCAMSGYPKEILLTLRVSDLECTEDAALQMRTRMESLLTNGCDRFESRHRRADGNILDVEINVIYLASQGKFLCFIHDITERKRTEEALREEILRRSILMDRCRDGIAIISQQHEVVEANRQFAEMLGYAPEEVIGLHTWDWEACFTEAEIRENFADLTKTNVVFETRHRRRDGSIYDVEVSASGARVGHEPLVFTVSRDISDRKRAEAALRESEELFRDTFEQAAVGMSIVSPAGDWLQVNQRLCDILGFSRDDLMRLSYWDITPPEYLEQDAERVRRMVTGVRSADTWEKRYIRSDRRSIWVRLTTALARSEDGQPKYFITVTEDITENKQAEEEKRRLEAQLRHAQKMEAVGTLAGGIAHEFNNILGIVLGNAEMAIDDLPEWSPARYSLNEIRSASLRAKDVVRQLLTFSRKTEENRRPLDLVPVVREAIKFLRSSIPANIELRQNIKDECHAVTADPTQIHQIMINLCTNAAHTMEEKGGILEFSLQDVTLDKRLSGFDSELKPGKYVMLTVSDTGSGIPPEILDRIFDPYFTTKEVGKGTGMGLAIVHGIVNNHGGSVRVQSELGLGTTFEIVFPAIEAAITPGRERKEAIPVGTERILFIDDEEPLAKLGGIQLERLGYRVHTETSPQKALELFASNPNHFDLLITDMTMPGITGDQMIAEVLQIRPDTPVILCTGFSERMDEERARTVGARAFIFKPLDRKQLAILVRETLDRQNQ